MHHVDHARQLARSIIAGRVLLAFARSIRRDYHPGGRHVGAVFPEVLVGTSVFVRYYRRGKPVSAAAISRDTGIPETNVRRYAAAMVRERILLKHIDGGYTFAPDYISVRQNPRALRTSMAALSWAARELQKLS
jgi:hypothetical protein